MTRKLAAIPIFLILFANHALAYSERTTHPALTAEIANLSGVSAEEKTWLMEGSQAEDTPPRWINHFYDPVNNSPWTGAGAGDIPPETLRTMASVGASTPVSAIAWIKGCNTQSAYWANGGNRTWEKALDYYVKGDMKEAYTTLGYILHIEEDMAVPDHTRDDTHAQDLGGDTGSPYEQYAAKYDPESIKALNIAGSLGGVPIPNFSSPEAYLTTMARYSNQYFFSKDTINSPKYPAPKIVWDDGQFAYGQDENGQYFPLAEKNISVANGDVIKSYSLLNKEEYAPIFDAYFSHLSKQAVLNGAGLVALFKKQAEEAKTNSEFFVDERHAVSKVACDTGETLSLLNPMGLVSGFGNLLSSLMGQLAGTLRGGIGFVVGLIAPKTNTPSIPPPADQNSSETDAPADVAEDFATGNEAGSDPNDSPAAQLAVATTTAPAATSSPAMPTSTAPTSTLARTEQVQATSSPRVVATTTATQTVVYSGGGGNGASQSQTNNPPPPPATSTPSTGKVFISEILFNGGETSGKEFVELYNLENFALDLSGWKLRYQFENSTTSHSLALIKSSSGDLSSISSHGYLLLGFGGYDSANYNGLAADITRSTSLPKGATQNVKIFLIDADEKEIDSTIYGKSSADPGQSLERMVASGGCVEASGEYEFSGNGCETGANKFSKRVSPQPQNSKSMPEPREKPSAPSPVGSELAVYNASSSTLDVAWNPSADALGSTSLITYMLLDMASSSSTLLATTTETRFALPARAGQIFMLGLAAKDRDGLSSEMSMVSTTIPNAAPTKPENFTAIFDEPGMALDLNWASSTDPDGNSGEITYEINISTSTELSSSTWTGVDKSLSTRGTVSAGENYTLGVRAKDSLGNYSEANIINWNFPSGFNPNLLTADANDGYFTFYPRMNGTIDKITVTDTNSIYGVCGNGRSHVWISGRTYDLATTTGASPEQYVYQIPPGAENILKGVPVTFAWQGYFTYQPSITQAQDWFNFGNQGITNLMYANYARCNMPIATSTATLTGM